MKRLKIRPWKIETSAVSLAITIVALAGSLACQIGEAPEVVDRPSNSDAGFSLSAGNGSSGFSSSDANSADSLTPTPVPPPLEVPDVPGATVLPVNCQGAGKITVLFETDLAEGGIEWAIVQRQISIITRACTYSRAGHGDSPGPPGKVVYYRGSKSLGAPLINPDRTIRDLVASLEAAEILPPYLLVGDGIGGTYQRLFASTYPERVSGLVLIEPHHPQETAQLTDVINQGGRPNIAAEKLLGQLRALDPIYASIENTGPIEVPVVILSPEPEAVTAVLIRSGFEGKLARQISAARDRLGTGIEAAFPNVSRIIAVGVGEDLSRNAPDLVLETIKRALQDAS